jgi:hypothetical protein
MTQNMEDNFFNISTCHLFSAPVLARIQPALTGVVGAFRHALHADAGIVS